MRTDAYPFSIQNTARVKSPRFVIKIEFETDSIYMTSHSDIVGVPGTVIHGVLQEPTALTQKIVPDEGRSEIGAFSFKLIDKNSQFTDEVRSRLQDGHGMRARKVRFWVGYKYIPTFGEEGFGAGGFGTGGFGTGTETDPYAVQFYNFQLFQTQIVKDCGYENGVYAERCNDITRELRAYIFDVKTTTLRQSITATDTTIPVYTTEGFQAVYHGAAYADAPNQLAGYIKVGDEIIRWTSKTDDSFTGCTRGVLSTKAVAVTVNDTANQDSRPKVSEYIYLEMPAVKLLWAVMTGWQYGTATTLPPHWHLGVSTDYLVEADFTGIGLDLWDPTDDTAGFVVQFRGIGKTDGKKFIESELLMLLGCYQPVYSDGRLGLKKMNQVLADAAYVVELNERNVVSVGELLHDMDGMHNQLKIAWNYNGSDYTRATVFIDAASVSTHGAVPLKTLSFKGLQGSRHTNAIIKQRLNCFRDRYTAPPQKIQVRVLPSMSRLEVGDIVRLKLTHVRDFAGVVAGIDRSFEIQQASYNYHSGDIELTLFGSTAAADTSESDNDSGSAALPDAFYTALGTNLTSALTINVIGGVGVVAAGTYTLTGNANMNAAGAVYYYNGDLSIPDGVTINVTQNVQIRVKGFLTVDGDIVGTGNGLAGVPGTGVLYDQPAGQRGYFGATRGMDGLIRRQNPGRGPGYSVVYSTVPCTSTSGTHSVAPLLSLAVSGNSLLGLPSDMRGTSGGPGGQIIRAEGEVVATGRAQQDLVYTYSLIADGGTGADGGAGLILISRGVTFGASSLINLSGDNSATPSPTSSNEMPGAGGVGCPGCLYVLIDGSDNFFPDIGGHFLAKTGTTGAPLQYTLGDIVGSLDGPIEGSIDAGFLSNVDYSNAAYRIQYIPASETAQDDDDVPVPSDLAAASAYSAIQLTWKTNQARSVGRIREPVRTEIFASVTNDRANAVEIGEVSGSTHVLNLALPMTYYFWIRNRSFDGTKVSGYNPSSATGGVRGSAFAVQIDGNLIESGESYLEGPVGLGSPP